MRRAAACWALVLLLGCRAEHEVHWGALPAALCAELQAAAEAHGFGLWPDSIDGSAGARIASKPPAQEIYIWERGAVRAPGLWVLLEPWLPGLRQLVDQRKRRVGSDRPTEFGWIFLRKYGPETRRDRLRPHTDSNQFSISLSLNSGSSDFEGGGLFVVRGKADNSDGFLEGLARKNSSVIEFPPQEPGVAVLYSRGLWHGVAPVESGVKYSLLLFADMHQEEIDGFNTAGLELTAGLVDERVSGGNLDLYQQRSSTSALLLQSQWPAGGRVSQRARAGEVLFAVASGDGAGAVRQAEWVMELNRDVIYVVDDSGGLVVPCQGEGKRACPDNPKRAAVDHDDDEEDGFSCEVQNQLAEAIMLWWAPVGGQSPVMQPGFAPLEAFGTRSRALWSYPGHRFVATRADVKEWCGDLEGCVLASAVAAEADEGCQLQLGASGGETSKTRSDEL